MAEALLGSDLKAWITERRMQGLSHEAIARELWDVTDKKVQVSLYTIRRWADEKKEASA